MSVNSGMKKKVRITKEAHYKPHGEFHHAAWVHLQHVEEKRDGNYYSLLSVFLLSAFALEAYLNYIGPKVEPAWARFDRRSPIEKLRHICSVLRIPVDMGTAPFSSVGELFKFRNKMAHPRDEELIVSYEAEETDFQKLYDMPRPKWMDFASKENATRCHSDIEKVIELINRKLPEPDLLPLNWQNWSGSASI